MIKPQDYEKIGEAASPYSFYMYQNVQMRNLAIPEKIEETFRALLRKLHIALFAIEKQKLLEWVDPNSREYLQIHTQLSQKEKSMGLRR